MGSYCLMGAEFQFYKMGRVLEMDGGDGYTLRIYLIVHLKMVKMVYFMLALLHQNFLI